MNTERWTERMVRHMRRWHGHAAEGDREEFEFARRHGGPHRHGRGFFGFGGHGGNPFGGNPFGGNPFARRTRAKRGDVRAAILALLSEQPRNGYQVMQELEQRSGGAWRPSPGSVYPAFQQLEDEGLIRAEDGGSGKVFHLTASGQAEAKKLAKAGEAPWEGLAEDDDDERMALFDQIRHVGMACMQIVHSGEPAQTEAATKVLAEARKALYRILAEDVPEQGK